jgi:hypothetical protein
LTKVAFTNKWQNRSLIAIGWSCGSGLNELGNLTNGCQQLGDERTVRKQKWVKQINDGLDCAISYVMLRYHHWWWQYLGGENQ